LVFQEAIVCGFPDQWSIAIHLKLASYTDENTRISLLICWHALNALQEEHNKTSVTYSMLYLKCLKPEVHLNNNVWKVASYSAENTTYLHYRQCCSGN
jgi:hypothetical protein